MYSQVCVKNSFHRGVYPSMHSAGGCVSQYALRPGQTPLGRTPLGRSPLGRHPLVDTHPWADIPPGRHPIPPMATAADGRHPIGMYSSVKV